MKAGLALVVVFIALPGMAAELLKNPRFDEPASASGAVAGWTQRGESFGKARLVKEPVVSAPQAVELSAIGKGSTGNDSFMLFQILPAAELRGRRIRFGARVRTEGAGINLVLYTPEGSANDFDGNVKTGDFRARSGVLEVPKNASLVSFGIQIFGPAGGKATVDDAFVEVDGGGKAAQAVPPERDQAGGKVRIAVDGVRVLREVNPWLYCMHIEWVENGLGLLERDKPVLREEVVSKLRPLHIPLFRFPGGIHADYYDWRMGIGPPEKRGASENVFTGKTEKHRFGTPEFQSLLETTKASALITASYGKGSATQAGEWAKYLSERHVSAPLWEVGNEIYLSGPKTDAPNGRRIFKPGETYGKDFPSYRAAIQKAMPSAKVGAIVHLDTGAFPLAPAENRDWSVRMLKSLRAKADFVSVHNAYAPVILDDSNDFSTDEKRHRAYQSLYAAAEQTRENLDVIGSKVDQLCSENRGIPLAVTEFGPLFGVSAKKNQQSVYVDQSRTLAAAIYVASLMDVFIGQPRVMAACYTNPIHRWYGSLLTDTDKGLVVTPTYHVYALYRSRFYGKLLSAQVQSPKFDAEPLGWVKKQSGVSEVVAKASRSDDGRQVGVMVVNRSVDKERDTEIVLTGFPVARVDCQVLSASSPAAANGPRLTDTTVSGNVTPRALSCEGRERVVLRLPPNSVVSLVAHRR